MPKLIQEQQQTAFDALKGEFGWTNRMQVPKLQKVVISVGVGKIAKDKIGDESSVSTFMDKNFKVGSRAREGVDSF